MKRIFFVLLALMLASGAAFAGGRGQHVPTDELGNFPSGPIRLVVPFGAGGGTDVFVRTVLRHVDPSVNIGVVNITGAAGLVGAMEVFHSANNGYTILATAPPDLVFFDLSGTSPVPLWSELEHICWAVSDFNGFFTHRNSGFTTIDEMAAFARANPGVLLFGTVGTRTVNALNSIRLLESLGIRDLVTMVPYDGGADIRTALLGGHIHASSNALGDVVALIESGDCIPMAIIGETRASVFPEIPSTRELGLGMTTPLPRALFAPPGTPRPRVEFISNLFRNALQNPALVAELNALFLDANFVDSVNARRLTREIYDDLGAAFARYFD